MAASIFVELESGTSAGRVHPHNGYYAGDFTTPTYVAPAAWQAPIAAFDPTGGSRNWLGVFLVTAEDAPTLLRDCRSVLDGMAAALA